MHHLYTQRENVLCRKNWISAEQSLGPGAGIPNPPPSRHRHHWFPIISPELKTLATSAYFETNKQKTLRRFMSCHRWVCRVRSTTSPSPVLGHTHTHSVHGTKMFTWWQVKTRTTSVWLQCISYGGHDLVTWRSPMATHCNHVDKGQDVHERQTPEVPGLLSTT